MQKRTMAEVQCDTCATTFEKPLTELKRNKTLGRRNFCSRICVGKASHSHLKEYQSNHNLKGYSRKDEFSGYRWHLRKATRRDKGCDLTLEYLKNLFESQEEKCVYTKVKLSHPVERAISNTIYCSSLDRIDSSKGYLQGNVQFISIAMNYMKGQMSDSETLDLIKIIKQS